jgi:hypothetical protein
MTQAGKRDFVVRAALRLALVLRVLPLAGASFVEGFIRATIMGLSSGFKCPLPQRLALRHWRLATSRKAEFNHETYEMTRKAEDGRGTSH